MIILFSDCLFLAMADHADSYAVGCDLHRDEVLRARKFVL
jgi:hypothetical protein